MLLDLLTLSIKLSLLSKRDKIKEKIYFICNKIEFERDGTVPRISLKICCIKVPFPFLCLLDYVEFDSDPDFFY